MGTANQNINDRIESYANEIKCDRHVPMWRACRWRNGNPCQCRIAVENSLVVKDAVENGSDDQLS